MHERFAGSWTTAGVRDGPTETCLQLYWSNISGVAGSPPQEEKQFSPKKMAMNCQFFAENSVSFGIHYALCAMLI